jgi:hypothetical protein
MVNSIDWTEKMFYATSAAQSLPLKIAATKIGDDVESLSTLSDICISHIQLTISH